MIKDEIIVKRYTDAFLGYAKESIGFENGIRELQDVRHVLRDNADFKRFLEAPDITNAEKDGVIDIVLREGFSEEVRHFLKLLLDHGRIDRFLDIAEYARMAYSHGVEIEGLLKSSYPLETRSIKRIKEALEKKLQRKLHLYIELDSSLLGGVYAKVGNIVIDGSVKRRFDDLREKLNLLKVI